LTTFLHTLPSTNVSVVHYLIKILTIMPSISYQETVNCNAMMIVAGIQILESESGNSHNLESRKKAIWYIPNMAGYQMHLSYTRVVFNVLSTKDTREMCWDIRTIMGKHKHSPCNVKLCAVKIQSCSSANFRLSCCVTLKDET
jgi:hypothetical protein